MFKLRGLGRLGAAARFARRRHPCGVKMYRLDRQPAFKSGTYRAPCFFPIAQRNGRCDVKYGAKRPKLNEAGYYWSCFRQYGGVVRVGVICFSHGLGTHKKVGHSGLYNSTRLWDAT